jgi:hypothetical protein
MASQAAAFCGAERVRKNNTKESKKAVNFFEK